jgi:hypothetical protein
MNKFFQIINKYIVLLIIVSLFGIPWFYFRNWFFKDLHPDSFIYSIPNIVDYLIRIIVIILLIMDYRKFKLKNVLISCISAFFYPLLGIVIFAILYLEKENANA